MGRVSRSEDSLALSRLYSPEAVGDYLANGGRFPPARREAADQLFQRALRSHLKELPSPDTPWGGKNPRSMLMLPFWHERYPRLRFVHVVRNGLDMAYSANQLQPTYFGEAVLPGLANRPPPVRAMLYWRYMNCRAADYGENRLGERYLRLRYEDLCLHPPDTVRTLFDFLGVDDPGRFKAAVGEVSRPPSIGRWRERPIEELVDLIEAGRDALRRFGYCGHELEDYRETPSRRRA
jgi:hypothetical protein